MTPGIYDIDDNLNLVINQVVDDSAGTYYCRLVPDNGGFQDASAPVEVIGKSSPTFARADTEFNVCTRNKGITCCYPYLHDSIFAEIMCMVLYSNYSLSWVNKIKFYQIIFREKIFFMVAMLLLRSAVPQRR